MTDSLPSLYGSTARRLEMLAIRLMVFPKESQMCDYTNHCISYLREGILKSEMNCDNYLFHFNLRFAPIIIIAVCKNVFLECQCLLIPAYLNLSFVWGALNFRVENGGVKRERRQRSCGKSTHSSTFNEHIPKC